eukprot:scaffold207989_cov21-Tisochrysis_lutea.AAC.2
MHDQVCGQACRAASLRRLCHQLAAPMAFICALELSSPCPAPVQVPLQELLQWRLCVPVMVKISAA